jgi:hypothetical protein
MDPRMSFKQLADETLTEAWHRYHGFMIESPNRWHGRLGIQPVILLWVVTKS